MTSSGRVTDASTSTSSIFWKCTSRSQPMHKQSFLACNIWNRNRLQKCGRIISSLTRLVLQHEYCSVAPAGLHHDFRGASVCNKCLLMNVLSPPWSTEEMLWRFSSLLCTHQNRPGGLQAPVVLLHSPFEHTKIDHRINPIPFIEGAHNNGMITWRA